MHNITLHIISVEDSMELKTKRGAIIIQQALIHSMNQLGCIPLPTVALLPDRMISQKNSGVESQSFYYSRCKELKYILAFVLISFSASQTCSLRPG